MLLVPTLEELEFGRSIPARTTVPNQLFSLFWNWCYWHLRALVMACYCTPCLLCSMGRIPPCEPLWHLDIHQDMPDGWRTQNVEDPDVAQGPYLLYYEYSDSAMEDDLTVCIHRTMRRKQTFFSLVYYHIWRVEYIELWIITACQIYD